MRFVSFALSPFALLASYVALEYFPSITLYILDYSLCDARSCLVCCPFLCVYALWEVDLAAMTFAE